MKAPKILVLNLPDPPFQIIEREYAGGFGVSKHTRLGRLSPLERPVLNLFLPYLAAVAEEEGCEYLALDAQALGYSPRETLQRTREFNPDIVIAMICLPSLYWDKKLLSEIKTELPNARMVACGTVCNVMPVEVLSSANIDLVAQECFPYVNSLKCLIDGFRESTKTNGFKTLPGFSYRQGSQVRSNPQKSAKKEFTEYYPKYHVLPLDKYQHFIDSEGKIHLFIPVLGGRGCPYDCFYCPYPIGFGRMPILQTPKKVVDQMEQLCESAHIDGFLFRNQSFISSQRWAEGVCEEILQRGLDISWLCEARVDQTSTKMLSIMSKSGCKRIHYGTETGDPSLLIRAKSGVRLETIGRAFDLARKFGIWRQAHIILGLPNETRQTLQNTLRFLLSLAPDSVAINFATPYPGTKLYDEALEKGSISTMDWTLFSSFNVILTNGSLTSGDLCRMARTISRETLTQSMATLLFKPLKKDLLTRCRLLARYYIPKLISESPYFRLC